MDTIIFEDLQFKKNYSINVSLEKTPESFPLHWHTYGEIVWAQRDHLIFGLQGQEYDMKKGDLLFIWPGELHSTIQAETASYMIIQFSNTIFTSFPEMAALQNMILSAHYISHEKAPDAAPAINRHMTEIKDAYVSPHPLNNMRMSLSLLHILLTFYDYCLETSHAYTAESPVRRFRTIQAVTEANRYIVENCDKSLTLETVAKHVGVNKFYFSRIFKEHLGISFCDYLAIQRVQRAILLLGDPQISIAEAAFQSGFGSIASFNRSFRKYKGCSPSKYREFMVRSD